MAPRARLRLHSPVLRLALALLAMGAAPAGAQTMADMLKARAAPQPAAPAAPQKKDKMIVEAGELVANKNTDVVTALGNVRIYYQGRTLEADRVVYDRRANRVRAEGNARLTEKDGTVSYGTRFDLTDDFKDGFVDSLRTDSAQNTHFTAARVERSDGEATVLDRGLYTACKPCADNPDKPPTWQIRAKRIVERNDEHTVYFEDAQLEFLGVPVAYVPYFVTADPSVTRQSGFLAPTAFVKTALGYGVSASYFWNIAPDYDLTLTPTVTTRQGFLGEAEWRQRLANGSYNIRVAGIDQADPGAFARSPFGAGNLRLRGEIETNGRFLINDKWAFGWNILALTDKYFLTDYHVPSQVLSNNFFKESISTAYLTGQGEHGYFDLRGYSIQGLSSHDLKGQQPLVLPVWDYNRAIDLRPEDTWGVGGQATIDFNLTSLSREVAAFQAANAPRTLDPSGLYDICPPRKIGGNPNVYRRSTCMLLGLAGDYTRATLDLSWKRRYIDPLGMVWQPFVFAHLNVASLNPNTTGVTSLGGGYEIRNAQETKFIKASSERAKGEALPGVGFEWRYPLLAVNAMGTQVLEPIAQIIARPNERIAQSRVNEDAQSLVFDDTTLFEWSKYSGYDRFEGGLRANVGLQYTMTFQNGGYANLLAGQSFQLAGNNSYAAADAANVGINSGLDKSRSDYVARAAVSPFSGVSFIAKGRFDNQNFDLRRLDVVAAANYGPLEASLQYARYQAQPAIGFITRREGLSPALKYRFLENYFAQGNVIFDLSRHLSPTGGDALFSPAGIGVGLGYQDDCTTFSVNYTNVLQDNAFNGLPAHNQTLLFSLKLRTLGDATIRTAVGSTVTQDGLTAGSSSTLR